jgi:hypothetical protein
MIGTWRLSCGEPLRKRGENMGSIVLQGREPFDLIAHRLATAVAESKIVAATVPIFAPGFPGNIAEIRILLNPQQAEDLARQLLLEAKRARENSV